MYEIKTEDIYEDCSNNKETLDLSKYSTKLIYYDDSNKLVIRDTKDETGGIAIGKFFGFQPKMYSYLVNDNSEHKKIKCVNRNVVVSHNKNKDALLNKKNV